MAELSGLTGLNPKVIQVLNPYCQDMIAIHGENLKSIILYGSATGEDFVSKRSNVNLMIVLGEVTQASLKNSLKTVAKGRKRGIVAPLFLSEEHIRRSADVFPIEFLEIQENHVVLYGDDPFESLEIDRSNIRLQCEHELKGKLIRVRQGYLERGLLKKNIASLLTESLTSFIPVFRNMLRLVGEQLPKRRQDVIEKTAERFDVSPDPFVKILRLKEGMKVPDARAVDGIFADYLTELDKLAIAIDEL
nr:hypothetical protein [Bacillota bacterium]